MIDRIGRLRTLAARCVYFCDEQGAIKRAQQANRRQVDAVLGAIQLTGPQPVDEIGAFTQQLNGVLDAYRKLVHDAPDGG